MADDCSILDFVTGGGLLPHVYCTGVVLENSGQVGKTDVTLQLELLQSKAGLQNSTWLNNLGNQETGNFMDSMYLQIVAVKNKKEDVLRLLPSNGMGSGFYTTTTFGDTTQTVTNLDFPNVLPPNVYVAKNKYGDNYLPRASAPSSLAPPAAASLTMLGQRVFESAGTDDLLRETPIQISNSSLLGNLTGADILLEYEQEGKVREKVIDGKPYYVIPFEHKIKGLDPTGTEAPDSLVLDRNLGFLFYTYLDAATWIQESSIDIDTDLLNNYFEQFIVEGPINTEVVFLDGKVPQYREAFFLPSGVAWEGSVHLHLCGHSADPTGYCGDGGLSNLTPAAALRGWMVGDNHVNTGGPQEKLRLARVPNNKVIDFRDPSFAALPAVNFGLGAPADTGVEYVGTQGLGPNYKNVSHLSNFLTSSFFQENRKYGAFKFQSNPELSDDGGLTVYDNDSEFSKLYVTRDKSNNARGVFFIDFESLLKNNSNLYPLLANISNERAQSIVENSQILELKLYRDRVKEETTGNSYESFENDEAHEEASQLVATISDQQGGQSINQSSGISEIALGSSPGEFSYVRYFMFTDTEVGTRNSGLYQYRIELKYLDGTYKHLYDLSINVQRELVALRDYYEFSTLSYPKQPIQANFASPINPAETYNKMSLAPYFSDGAFAIQFFDDVLDHHILGQWKPWISSPSMLFAVADGLFGLWSSDSTGFDSLKTMISPASGSPQGILFFIKMLGTVSKKLEHLLAGTKINKSAGELNNISVPGDGPDITAYTFNNMLDVIVSPSDSTIEEQHTFNSPSELFRALQNEGAYIDYLDLGDTLVKDFEGLRSVSPLYYEDRCMLEAAKFSPQAATVGGFKNANIHPWPWADPAGTVGDQKDTFANTGYSYLTPSIVELSDPTDSNQSFNYKYQVFSGPNARNYVRSSPGPPPAEKYSVLHSENFDFSNCDDLFISVLNYNLHGEDLQSADLSSYGPDFVNVPTEENTKARHREPYKRFFEQSGLTLHVESSHDDFFDKEPNKLGTSPTIPDSGLESVYKTDFSDGTVDYRPLLRAYMAQHRSLFITPPLPPNARAPWATPGYAPGEIDYNKDLPLAFKFRAFWILKPDLTQPMFASAYSTNQRAFFFMNHSLTSKVEYYTGASVDPAGNPRPRKYDRDSWGLLTQDVLNNIGTKILFCRLSLYDESLTHQADLSMVDKYFLIYYGGMAGPQNPGIGMPAAVPPPQNDVPSIFNFVQYSEDDSARHVWDTENQIRVREFTNKTAGTTRKAGPRRSSGRKPTRGVTTNRTDKRLPEVKLAPPARNTVAASILTGESTPGMSARDRISLAADLLAKRATKVPGASVGMPRRPEVKVVAEPTPTPDLGSAIAAGLTDQMSVIEILQKQSSTADAGQLAVVNNKDLAPMLVESGGDGYEFSTTGYLAADALVADLASGEMSFMELQQYLYEQQLQQEQDESEEEEVSSGQLSLAMALDENVEEPLSSSNSGAAAVEILEGGTGNGLSEEEQIDAAVEVLITGQSTSDAVEEALEEETGATIQDLIAQALAAAQAIAAANDDNTAAQQLAAVDEHAPPPPEEEEEDEEPEVVISMPYMGGGPLGH